MRSPFLRCALIVQHRKYNKTDLAFLSHPYFNKNRLCCPQPVFMIIYARYSMLTHLPSTVLPQVEPSTILVSTMQAC